MRVIMALVCLKKYAHGFCHLTMLLLLLQLFYKMSFGLPCTRTLLAKDASFELQSHAIPDIREHEEQQERDDTEAQEMKLNEIATHVQQELTRVLRGADVDRLKALLVETTLQLDDQSRGEGGIPLFTNVEIVRQLHPGDKLPMEKKQIQLAKRRRLTKWVNATLSSQKDLVNLIILQTQTLAALQEEQRKTMSDGENDPVLECLWNPESMRRKLLAKPLKKDTNDAFLPAAAMHDDNDAADDDDDDDDDEEVKEEEVKEEDIFLPTSTTTSTTHMATRHLRSVPALPPPNQMESSSQASAMSTPLHVTPWQMAQDLSKRRSEYHRVHQTLQRMQPIERIRHRLGLARLGNEHDVHDDDEHPTKKVVKQVWGNMQAFLQRWWHKLAVLVHERSSSLHRFAPILLDISGTTYPVEQVPPALLHGRSVLHWGNLASVAFDSISGSFTQFEHNPGRWLAKAAVCRSLEILQANVNVLGVPQALGKGLKSVQSIALKSHPTQSEGEELNPLLEDSSDEELNQKRRRRRKSNSTKSQSTAFSKFFSTFWKRLRNCFRNILQGLARFVVDLAKQAVKSSSSSSSSSSREEVESEAP